MSNKLTKEYTLNNINEFYEELNNNLNSTHTKFLVWTAYHKEQKTQKECNEICSAYNVCAGSYYSCNKVTDNIFIVTRHFNKGKKEYYIPCIKKDGLITRYNVAFNIFDQAVIAAYSYLYTGNEDAGYWACKLMDIK